MGCLAMVQFGNEMVIRYYSGTLMYMDLYGDKNSNSSYGKGVTFVIMKEFQMYTVHINNDVQDSTGRSHHA